MMPNVLTFGWGLGDLFYFYIQILWLIILLIFLVVILIKTLNFSILISKIILNILISQFNPVTGDSLSEVWRFLHTHYADVTLQGFALGLRRKVK